MTEEIKTQFVAIVLNIIDISEKCSKLNTKDIDKLINNVGFQIKNNILL